MQSLAANIADKISDLADARNKNQLLEEISFYAISEKDGSVVYSLEWQGAQEAHKIAQDMLVFFTEIKNLIKSMMNETVEQVPPELNTFGNLKDGLFQRIVYRFRSWPSIGPYEDYSRSMESK